jgi:hypothetical protein
MNIIADLTSFLYPGMTAFAGAGCMNRVPGFTGGDNPLFKHYVPEIVFRERNPPNCTFPFQFIIWT